MTIYNLSHTDADGYGSQYILNEFAKSDAKLFGHKGAVIKSYNADYDNLEAVVENKILADMKMDKGDKLLLITDLNIEREAFAVFLEKQIKEMGSNTKLILIDHHMTGKELADKFEWYKLQGENCATRFLFETLEKQNKTMVISDRVKKMVACVDKYDLYKEEGSDEFWVGAYLQDLSLNSSKIFPKETLQDFNRELVLFQFDEVSKLLESGQNIRQISKQMVAKTEGKVLEIINRGATPAIAKQIERIFESKIQIVEEMMKESITLIYPEAYGEIKSGSGFNYEPQSRKIFPGGMEEYRNDFLRILDRIVEERVKNEEPIKNISVAAEVLLQDYLKEEIVKLKGSLSKEEIASFNEIASNGFVPIGVAVAQTLGAVAMESMVVGHLKLKNLDVEVKLFVDIDTTFFQHASKAYTRANPNVVALKLDSKKGSMSVRAINEKAFLVASQLGGGGHVNASGGCVPPEEAEALGISPLDNIIRKLTEADKVAVEKSNLGRSI